MYYKNFITVITIVFLCLACVGNARLESALELSGENREALEAVLAHYAHSPAESLKYKAACFLIENMPGHYAVDPALVAQMQPVYDEHRKLSERFRWEKNAIWGAAVDSLTEVYRKRYGFDFRRNPSADIRHVTSGYLIREIDLAFRAWQENEYTRRVSFDDFCEYILPYRCQDGYLLDDSRSRFYEKHAGFFSGKHRSVQEATDSLLSEYRDFIHNDFYGASIPIYTVSALEQIKRGLCEHRCYFNSRLLSALGLPVAVDFVPHWGNRRHSHSWNVLAMDGESFPFEPYWEKDPWKYKTLYNNVSRHDHWGKFRLPKVFRCLYSQNPEGPVVDRKVAREDIPPLFRNINRKDVSAQYFETTDVRIRLTEPAPAGTKYAYLAVFDDRQWHVVQWGTISRKTGLFKGMGRDIVYLPVYYSRGRTVPAAAQFYLDPSGKIKELIPEGKLISVGARAVNGSMFIADMINDRRYIGGGHLVGMSGFPGREVDTLYQIPKNADLWHNTAFLDGSKAYRTIRLQVPGDEFRLCEIAFYVPDVGKERRVYPTSVESDLIPVDSSRRVVQIVDRISATGFRGKIKDPDSPAFVDFHFDDTTRFFTVRRIRTGTRNTNCSIGTENGFRPGFKNSRTKPFVLTRFLQVAFT